ncbi:pyrroline-5-carboxylate reductase [Clostridia bacterium]|nr:pyrroline-5-carboxylate reductase [Clostridia bacterium]
MAADYDELLLDADFFIIAVKPAVCRSLLSSFAGKVKGVAVSIAAGITTDTLGGYLGDVPIIRVMPNINAQIGESVSAICRNDRVSDADFEKAKTIFSQIGSINELDEKFFPIFSTLASCSPAFTYLYIDSLARAAQKLGMSKRESINIAAKAVAGSAKMLLYTDRHPHDMIDSVCSPAGTTIEGLCKLSELGFENAVVRAFEACVNKDKSIGDN